MERVERRFLHTLSLVYHTWEYMEQPSFTVTSSYETLSICSCGDEKKFIYFIEFLYVHISEKARSINLSYFGHPTKGCRLEL